MYREMGSVKRSGSCAWNPKPLGKATMPWESRCGEIHALLKTSTASRGMFHPSCRLGKPGNSTLTISLRRNAQQAMTWRAGESMAPTLDSNTLEPYLQCLFIHGLPINLEIWIPSASLQGITSLSLSLSVERTVQANKARCPHVRSSRLYKP